MASATEDADQQVPPYAEDVKSHLDFQEVPPPPGHVETAPSGDVEGERRVRATIAEAAPQNTKLLNDIQSTEEAVSTLQGNEYRLNHAKEELKSQDKTVGKAEETSKAEMAEYTKNKYSRTRRWYYILTRMRLNYEKKVKNAEESYHSALATQNQAEKRQLELQHDIQAIEEENSRLEKIAEKHVEAHKAIDKLYADIFTGPTPGFPDEDEREAAYKAANAEHEATTQTLKAMTKSYRHVQSIKASLDKATTEMKRADYETDSAFFISDYTQIFVEKAARFVGRAMELRQEAVNALPTPLDRDLIKLEEKLETHLNSASRQITASLRAVYPSRSMLENMISNAEYALKLASDAQVELAKLTRQYELTAKDSVRITSRAKEDARQALHEIRQGAFEVIVGFGAAAPPYHECCDRAAWFENDSYDQCERIPVPTVDENELPPLPSYEEVAG